MDTVRHGKPGTDVPGVDISGAEVSGAAAPLIIRGITTRGARFRPSDWADRLAGAFAVIDPNNRTNYSPYVQPTTLDGIPCIVVDKKLKTSDPDAFRFLQSFASSNELLVENTE